jgi:tetratricopeptide (TPR) repeat protein
MLSSIFDGLKTMEGPKTLVLVTEGMGVEDRAQLRNVAAMASAARVSLFVLQLDSPLFADASRRGPAPTPTSAGEDEALLTSPLFDLASLTRGTVFRVSGTGDRVFERVAHEIGAYYLLGFEPEANDRDGKDHSLTVVVAGRQATVRSRARVNIPLQGVRRKDEEVLASLMRAPFPATDLPIRVATFAQRDRASGKVRLLVSAEVGQVQGGGLVTGYVLVDEKGKVAVSGGQRLSEVRGSDLVPMLGSEVVDPGNYTLKFAAVDLSGRRGSVERVVQAAVVQEGGLEIGDLLLGPLPAKDSPLRPGVDLRVTGATLRTHLELYSKDAARLESATVTFEVAEGADQPAILTLLGSTALAPEGDRRAAQASVHTELLPPGDYVARAVVAVGAKPVAAMTQPFRVLPTTGSGERIPLAGLSSSIPRFDRADVFRPEFAGHFLDRMGELVRDPATPIVAEAVARARRGESESVLEALGNAPPDLRVAFLRGVGHLARGETTPAAAQLRTALRLSSSFMPATVYLGACYAATGEDLQAAGAWQTALVTETKNAVLYALLIDALLRANQPETAVEFAKEALLSWPRDAGLGRRLGVAQAMVGNRGEALAVLVPYVEAHPADAGAVFVTLRLLFQGFAQGKKPEEKERLVRYAQAYVDARGPNQEIVSQWLRYLKKDR